MVDPGNCFKLFISLLASMQFYFSGSYLCHCLLPGSFILVDHVVCLSFVKIRVIELAIFFFDIIFSVILTTAPLLSHSLSNATEEVQNWQKFPTHYFMKFPCIACPPPAFFATLFLLLNVSSCHIQCVILLTDIMDLNLLSLVSTSSILCVLCA